MSGNCLRTMWLQSGDTGGGLRVLKKCFSSSAEVPGVLVTGKHRKALSAGIENASARSAQGSRLLPFGDRMPKPCTMPPGAGVAGSVDATDLSWKFECAQGKPET